MSFFSTAQLVLLVIGSVVIVGVSVLMTRMATGRMRRGCIQPPERTKRNHRGATA